MIFLMACSSKTATTSAATTSSAATSAAAATKTLNIGMAIGFTSGTYLDALREAELMVDQDNAAGGLLIGSERYKINLIKYDSGITQGY